MNKNPTLNRQPVEPAERIKTRSARAGEKLKDSGCQCCDHDKEQDEPCSPDGQACPPYRAVIAMALRHQKPWPGS